MPSGKYYCDYCEKEFQDTQFARKRHRQSKPHLRAKALWYSSSSASASDVSNFVPRGRLCSRFVTSNYCPFGDSCRYLHPVNNIPGSTGFTNNTHPHAGLLTQRIQPSTLTTRDFASGRPGTSWFDLPPSLKPPPEHGYPQLPSIDWG